MSRISVIVPVYNTELYLKNCVDSILRQTFKDFELILIDDGASDNSASLCKEYADADTRVKYFYQENSGASVARNHGIDVATGDFITFIDSDDWIDEDYLELLLAESERYDIVQIGNHVFTADGQTNRGDQVNSDLEEKINGKDLCIRLLEGKYQSGGVPWGKLYRKELWEDIRFPAIQRFEDVAVLYKIYWKASEIHNVKTAKYCYRSQRPGSIMHSKFTLSWLEIVDVENDRVSFFKMQNEKQLYTLARYNLVNQIINMIITIKRNMPQEKKEIRDLKRRLIRESTSLLFCRGYMKKKVKMLLKVVSVMIKG
ncbi:MAG: glycosyltransferase [Lachnospiraceae bacterium]|nr:glycosyltransferase [Lachnospiraceae bacterium]